MESPLMKFSWFVTALASIHHGLGMVLGYNVFNLPIFQTTLLPFVQPLHYVIGISGIISLIMFFTMTMCCSCGKSNCGCGKGKTSGNCCSKCGGCPCKCQPTPPASS